MEYKTRKKTAAKSLIMDRHNSAFKAFCQHTGRAILPAITAIPTLSIIFILFFIAKEALPFFENISYVKEFFTSTNWTPSKDTNPHFGALAIFYGTAMVTVGSCVIAVPLGIIAAVCLNEILPHNLAQKFKPVVELLAAVPSVAYGFFALVVFAPILQNHGGAMMSVATVLAGLPIALVASVLMGEFFSSKFFGEKESTAKKLVKIIFPCAASIAVLWIAAKLFDIEISSGTNALNASLILAIMALPTIVSISQDALSAVGRDMREGALALGSTRFETIFKILLPCAKSGIAVAVILGFMRVVGETMVVWMASGNALKIPEPFYNFFEPVRTLTATIAGEMGEADQSTGSARYHVLFAMSFCLLVAGLLMNAASQWIGSGMKLKKK